LFEARVEVATSAELGRALSDPKDPPQVEKGDEQRVRQLVRSPRTPDNERAQLPTTETRIRQARKPRHQAVVEIPVG